MATQPVCLQMLLKCADIGHLAADQETHKRWAYQLEEEFFQQVIYRPQLLSIFVVSVVDDDSSLTTCDPIIAHAPTPLMASTFPLLTQFMTPHRAKAAVDLVCICSAVCRSYVHRSGEQQQHVCISTRGQTRFMFCLR